MKILVTGAAGFIAHKICELLLKSGNSVIGIDNLNDYYDVNLKLYRIEQLKRFEKFKFFKIDIENFNELSELFKVNKFRVIYNLAARAGVRYSLINPWIYFRTNTEGTLNLLELMKNYNVKKFILASTSSLYAGSQTPFKEDLPVNTPISPYAASKKAAETLSYTYHLQYDIDVSILRYFTVFGPGGRPDMAPYRFVKNILENKEIIVYGDGNQARDFTYVDDIALGTILAEKPIGYEIINLGGGKEAITLNKFINWIEEITSKKAIIKYEAYNSADMLETRADITKAKRLLNWEPTTTTYDGIRRIADYPEMLKFTI